MDRRTALVPLRYVALPGHGPEDVVADSEGRILTGVADGRILRVDGLDDPSAARVERLAEITGRPLGLELLPDGDLLVCSADGALLRVDLGGSGRVQVLTETAAGERLRFCSNVVALPDGTVYFTVSSRVHPLRDWMGDIVEHSGTGRLLRLAPGAREAEVVLEGLQFANGLVRGGDDSCLIVAETGARRLTRFRLTGPRAGQAEPLAGNLPGFPDNMWRGAPDGPVWVALAGPRMPPLGLLHRAGPAVRRRAARLALHVPYRPSGTTGVLAIDDDGRVLHRLTRRRSGFRMVTGVCETGGRLVLGSLWERGIAICEAPVIQGY
ncbi:SMP-30/gluconolactonase/LRE family protein [Streptomyces sp. ID05-04B]|uniref:SMP-30/gluconolactonase/LRE family protein n=1 Tax=unclassified Streptomyces TaxID=2593676 RepID=UPI000D1B695A|nr:MULTISPECIES: SMP-30/gluconolactonase/LRE family protein [unclassified Streptomyces]AVV47966.1 strictosidine synthase [Streptomyces sp. P3]MDX5566805.1 SMP-30/gluconolactonase/LRE family protein [Streptomyces sp. ID05-04B]